MEMYEKNKLSMPVRKHIIWAMVCILNQLSLGYYMTGYPMKIWKQYSQIEYTYSNLSISNRPQQNATSPKVNVYMLEIPSTLGTPFSEKCLMHVQTCLDACVCFTEANVSQISEI